MTFWFWGIPWCEIPIPGNPGGGPKECPCPGRVCTYCGCGIPGGLVAAVVGWPDDGTNVGLCGTGCGIDCGTGCGNCPKNIKWT